MKHLRPLPTLDDEFFVGYLPTPRALTTRLRQGAISLLVVAALLAGGVALSQRDPGPGEWDLSRIVDTRGRIEPGPHPLMRTDDGRVVLLVGEAKHAAAIPARSDPLTAGGSVLSRDGWEMLEVVKLDQPTAAADPVAVVRAGPDG